MSTEKTRPGYSRSHRAVEITSIALVVGMLVMMAMRVGRAIESTGDWIYLGFTALTGYLTADFLSGVVHWAGDSGSIGPTVWALAAPAPNAVHATTHTMFSTTASATVVGSLLTAPTRRPRRDRWAFPEASPSPPCSRARAALAW